MLIGLISICTPSEEGDDVPRGMLRFAGQSIAERQMDLALRMGCERIVCLVEGISEDVIELQQAAQDHHVKFNAVTGGMSLLGQISINDDLLIFADGLLPEASAVERHLSERPAVLVIPAEGAVEEGFERLDSEWAWAGVLRTRGSVVEGLSQLPPDSDPISALLRISLQQGTKVVPLDGAKARRSGWLLATSDAALEDFENEFLRRHAPRASFMQPVRAIADRIALKIAAPLLERGRGGFPLVAAGLLSAAGAVAAGTYGYALAGLGLLVFGSFIFDIGSTLATTLGAISQKNASVLQRFADQISPVFEIAFIALAVMLAGRNPAVEDGFLAVMLMGLVLLARMIPPSRLTLTFHDRTLVLLILAVAGWLAVLRPTMAVGSLVLLGLLAWRQWRNRLTPA